MKGVFYNETNDTTAETKDGEEVEVGGVYSSEKEWVEAEVTTIPDEHIIEDSRHWGFEEGHVVAIRVDGELDHTAYRVKEIKSRNAIEPKKIILTNPDLSKTYIFNWNKDRYIVELKEPDKPSRVVGLDPSKENMIYPIQDDWLMQEFDATHNLIAKML